MRRSALLATFWPRMLLTAGLFPVAGCSGLGHFVADTETIPGQNPNAATGVSENDQRVRGHEPATEAMLPEPGDVWPGPPQPLPSLADVAHGSLGNDMLGGGATMPKGGSMSMGEQNAVQGGVPVNNDFSGAGFSGGGLSEGIPDPATRFRHPPGPDSGQPNGGGTVGNAGGKASAPGNIVIPNGDGTSTVISPDGAVKTIKGPPN